jgi:hypothetical protein
MVYSRGLLVKLVRNKLLGRYDSALLCTATWDLLWHRVQPRPSQARLAAWSGRQCSDAAKFLLVSGYSM